MALIHLQHRCGGNDLLLPAVRLHQPALVASLHTSQLHLGGNSIKVPKENEISEFMMNNDKKYPPQKPGEEPRPAVSILCVILIKIILIRL